MKKKADVPQGTMDMLILQSLVSEPMHGYGITRRLEQITGGVFQVNPGTLFPSLYRLGEEGLIRGSWGLSATNRRARYYRLTRAGRKQLERERERWDVVSVAIRQVLEA